MRKFLAATGKPRYDPWERAYVTPSPPSTLPLLIRRTQPSSSCIPKTNPALPHETSNVRMMI